MMEDITQSLNRLNQLSFRLRLLREQAVWQREATSTVSELLAAAADLEALAAERMRLLATVSRLPKKPTRSVPKAVVDDLPSLLLTDEDKGEPCSVCLGRLDGSDAEPGEDADRKATGCCRLPCHCKSRFHRHCISTWLGMNYTCPVCRFEMPYEETPPEPAAPAAAEGADGSGEVAATVAAREAAASLVELAAYDAVTMPLLEMVRRGERGTDAAAAAAAAGGDDDDASSDGDDAAILVAIDAATAEVGGRSYLVVDAGAIERRAAARQAERDRGDAARERGAVAAAVARGSSAHRLRAQVRAAQAPAAAPSTFAERTATLRGRATASAAAATAASNALTVPRATAHPVATIRRLQQAREPAATPDLARSVSGGGLAAARLIASAAATEPPRA